MSADILLPLSQDIWQKEKFPKEWKKGIIIKVPKKDILVNAETGEVSLLAVISKIFNKIILEWIKNSMEMDLQKEQARLCHIRSCIEQINTLKVIIEQSVEFQPPLYMLFVDYRRAFDSLSRAWIWDEIRLEAFPANSQI